MGCLFKLAANIFSAFFFLVIASGALAAFLVFNGNPTPCVDRALQPAPEADEELQANWLDVLDGVSRGERVQLSLTEEQASSLGQAYLDDRDVPVEDLRVYFCPSGTAQAAGRITTGILGLESHVLIRGTLEVDGDTNRVDIDEVRVGQFPHFLSGRIYDLLVDEDDVRNLPIAQNIDDIRYRDGEAIVTVAP